MSYNVWDLLKQVKEIKVNQMTPLCSSLLAGRPGLVWAVIVWVLVAHWQLMRRFVRQTVPLLHQARLEGQGGGGGDNTSPWAVVMLIARPVLPVLVFIMFQSIMINQRDSE